MSLLRAALVGPKSKSPVPYVARSGGGMSGLFGGLGARSNAPIDQMGAVGTLFSVVSRIAEATSAVEWDLWNRPADGRITGGDERTPAGKHAALDLIRLPNAFTTWSELVQMLVQHRRLVGEWILIVVKAGRIPVEVWPVRPDRMTPVTDPSAFMRGWIYKTPDGEKIPLALDQVIQSKMPNPTDPYRGMGAVQTILTELESAQAAAEWNRNFFRNSAEPGGVIELPVNLSDSKWDEFVDRWRTQHQGVNNAHRVAVIEHAGKYVPRGFTQRDMEFNGLREAGRDTILEAFGISRATLGITDGVNFAAAKAAAAQFNELLVRPECRALQTALNHRLLPMFYPGALPNTVPVEFDFDLPETEDSAEAAADRTSRVDAVIKLAGYPGVKFDVDALMSAFDLPEIPWEEAAVPLPGQMFGPDGEILPPPPNAPPGGDSAGAPGPQRGAPPGGAPSKSKPAPGKQPAKNVANADDPPAWDPAIHARIWDDALARLLDKFKTILTGWRGQLRQQIIEAIDGPDLPKLADLSVNTDHAAQVLHDELVTVAQQSAAEASREAAEQGATAPPTPPPLAELAAVAVATAALLGEGESVTAGREALRRHDGERSGEQVAGAVVEALNERSDRPTRDALGGAVTGTQNRARVATWRKGPVGSIYADETLDENTCGPCAAIHGRFICTTDDLAPLNRLYTAIGGYVDCQGRERCRGTVTGAWRPGRK